MAIHHTFPEGTDRNVQLLRWPADSPVGKCVLVRDMQYEVREGSEAGEVVIVPVGFIANCNSSFILLEVVGNEEGGPWQEI